MRLVIALLAALLAGLGLAQVVEGEAGVSGYELHQHLRSTRPDWNAQGLQPKQAVITALGSGRAIRIQAIGSPLVDAKSLGLALAKVADSDGRVVYQRKAWWSIASGVRSGDGKSISIDMTPVRAELTRLGLESTLVAGPEGHSTMLSTSVRRIYGPKEVAPPLLFETTVVENDWDEFGFACLVPGLAYLGLSLLFVGCLARLAPARRVTLIRWFRYPALALLVLVYLWVPRVLPGADKIGAVVLSEFFEPLTVSLALISIFGALVAWILDRVEYAAMRVDEPKWGRSAPMAILEPAAPFYFLFGPAALARDFAVHRLDGFAETIVGWLVILVVAWPLSLLWKPWVRSLGVIEFDPTWHPDLTRAVAICREWNAGIREVVIADYHEHKSIRPVFAQGSLWIPRKSSKVLDSPEFDVAVTYAVLTTPKKVWTSPLGGCLIVLGVFIAIFVFTRPPTDMTLWAVGLWIAHIFAWPKLERWLGRLASNRALDEIVRLHGLEAFPAYVAKATRFHDFDDEDPWGDYKTAKPEVFGQRKP